MTAGDTTFEVGGEEGRRGRGGWVICLGGGGYLCTKHNLDILYERNLDLLIIL